jgi:hypothetical protein
VNAMIETSRVTIVEGRVETFQAEGCLSVIRCAACNGKLWSHIPQLGEAIAFVAVGALDEGQRLTPEAHYFTRSRFPWVALPPGVPAFDALGDPGKPGVGQRIKAALSERTGLGVPSGTQGRDPAPAQG